MVLICYDVTDDRRRTRIGNELENFGKRVQRSVFECHLNERELLILRERLEGLCSEGEDRIGMYRICRKDQDWVVVDGSGSVTRDWEYRLV